MNKKIKLYTSMNQFHSADSRHLKINNQLSSRKSTTDFRSILDLILFKLKNVLKHLQYFLQRVI
jgi:hypothetical protein